MHIHIAGRPNHLRLSTSYRSGNLTSSLACLPSWRIIYEPSYVTAVQYRGLSCRTEYKKTGALRHIYIVGCRYGGHFAIDKRGADFAIIFLLVFLSHEIHELPYGVTLNAQTMWHLPRLHSLAAVVLQRQY